MKYEIIDNSSVLEIRPEYEAYTVCDITKESQQVAIVIVGMHEKPTLIGIHLTSSTCFIDEVLEVLTTQWKTISIEQYYVLNMKDLEYKLCKRTADAEKL